MTAEKLLECLKGRVERLERQLKFLKPEHKDQIAWKKSELKMAKKRFDNQTLKMNGRI